MTSEGKRFRVLVLVIALAMGAPWLLKPGRATDGRLTHAPIAIYGDANFTAANGVTGGRGTTSDPYIIEGWDISAPGSTAILVRNTHAPFVIRNVQVHNSTTGIGLYNAPGGSIVWAMVTGNTFGVDVDRSNGTTVASTTLNGNLIKDIFVWASTGVMLEDSTLSNGGTGISLNDVTNTLVLRNKLDHHTGVGIQLWHTGGITIEANTVTNTSSFGVTVPTPAPQSQPSNSSQLTIRDNVLNRNYGGIYLDHTKDATIQGNRISDNSEGLVLMDHAVGIRIFNNALVDNWRQASGGGPGNAWDAGYPQGGNYWSDYTGLDLRSGPRQDLCCGDGVGDSPYTVRLGGAVDAYPLVKPGYSPTNTKPVASFTISPPGGRMPTNFTLDGSASYDREDPTPGLEARWDWDGDGAWDSNWSIEKVAHHAFPRPGTYTVRLQVRDSGGLVGEANRTLEVKTNGVFTDLSSAGSPMWLTAVLAIAVAALALALIRRLRRG